MNEEITATISIVFTEDPNCGYILDLDKEDRERIRNVVYGMLIGSNLSEALDCTPVDRDRSLFSKAQFKVVGEEEVIHDLTKKIEQWLNSVKKYREGIEDIVLMRFVEELGRTLTNGFIDGFIDGLKGESNMDNAYKKIEIEEHPVGTLIIEFYKDTLYFRNRNCDGFKTADPDRSVTEDEIGEFEGLLCGTAIGCDLDPTTLLNDFCVTKRIGVRVEGDAVCIRKFLVKVSEIISNMDRHCCGNIKKAVFTWGKQ